MISPSDHDRSMGRPLGPTQAAIDDAADECARLTELKAALLAALKAVGPASQAYDPLAGEYDKASDALVDAERHYWELTGEDYE